MTEANDPAGLSRADRLDVVEGVMGALAGQVIVLLAQNRALQQLLIEHNVLSAAAVRETTLDVLDAELDDLAEQILPAELSAPVKGSLREAIRAARAG